MAIADSEPLAKGCRPKFQVSSLCPIFVFPISGGPSLRLPQGWDPELALFLPISPISFFDSLYQYFARVPDYVNYGTVPKFVVFLYITFRLFAPFQLLSREIPPLVFRFSSAAADELRLIATPA